MSTPTKKVSVLLMAYGSPNTIEEVKPYFTDIRGGKTPEESILKTIEHHYELVGGKTPLLAITKNQAKRLQSFLNKRENHTSYTVFIGMKHWHPYIKEAIEQIKKEKTDEIVAIPLAPHYSQISIGGYKKAVEESLQNVSIPLTFIDDWHRNSYLIDCIVAQTKDAISHLPPEKTYVFFTAHSLPKRIETWHDPYQSNLEETMHLVNQKLHLTHYGFSFQSAGSTQEPWLEPDILDELQRVHREGFTHALVCPIGFVSDHLEILFDLDIEAKKTADKMHMNLSRTSSRNSHPLFIKALASLIP